MADDRMAAIEQAIAKHQSILGALIALAPFMLAGRAPRPHELELALRGCDTPEVRAVVREWLDKSRTL